MDCNKLLQIRVTPWVAEYSSSNSGSFGMTLRDTGLVIFSFCRLHRPQAACDDTRNSARSGSTSQRNNPITVSYR